MPKIQLFHKPCKGSPTGALRDHIHFTAKEGVFHFTIPTWGHGAGITRLEDASVAGLEQKLCKWIKDWDASQQQTTRVILYKVKAEPTFSSDPNLTIEIAAGIYDETVTKREGTDDVFTYHHARFAQDEERLLPYSLMRGMDIFNGTTQKHQHPGRVLYTPENAALFRRIQEGMEKVIELVQAITGRPDLFEQRAKELALPTLGFNMDVAPDLPQLDLAPCPECRWAGGRIDDTPGGLHAADLLHRKHCPTCTNTLRP